MKVYKLDYELRFANTEWIEADTPEEAQEQLATLAFLDYKVAFDDETLEFDDFIVVAIEEEQASE